MFTKISLSNIGAFDSNIEFDLFANKRDTTLLHSLYEVDDKGINRIVGIIGGNTVGKTTTLDTLSAVGSFMSFAFKKKSATNLDKTKLLEIFNEETADIYWKDFLRDFDHAELPNVNKKSNQDAIIDIEMYIDASNDKTGFYNYYLRYNDDYITNGIVEEKLTFRKKYNSKKVLKLFSLSNHKQSEIGYKLAYAENLCEEFKTIPKILSDFEEKLDYYEIFFNHYVSNSFSMNLNTELSDTFATKIISKNKEYYEKIVKLADADIQSIEIVDENNRKKMNFHYNNYSVDYYSLSEATRKLVEIGYALKKVVQNKGVFIIDEIENSLNLEICKNIISIFQDLNLNNCSQFIFTTHNPELVNLLRKDQIYILTKKDLKVTSTKFSNFISPLTNKKIRSDCSFVKAYKTNLIYNYQEDLKEQIKKLF